MILETFNANQWKVGRKKENVIVWPVSTHWIHSNKESNSLLLYICEWPWVRLGCCFCCQVCSPLLLLGDQWLVDASQKTEKQYCDGLWRGWCWLAVWRVGQARSVKHCFCLVIEWGAQFAQGLTAEQRYQRILEYHPLQNDFLWMYICILL